MSRDETTTEIVSRLTRHQGEYETDTKTVLANLAGTFVNLSRNAPPINQQASHKEQK